MPTRKLVSFDWALKRLLRSKANFEVLEGFLSELLHEALIHSNSCHNQLHMLQF
jgi:hypothetical protein